MDGGLQGKVLCKTHSIKSIIIFTLHCKQNRAFECLFNSNSYFFPGCDDQKRAEDNEGESEAILDQDVVKFILLGVSQDQVDVVVGEVDEDEPWEEEERTRGYS